DVFQREAEEIIRLTIGEEEIAVTAEHPFYSGAYWREAGQLTVGDSILLFDGNPQVISAVQVERGRFKVYNFEVEDWHSYYVAEVSVLVHNAGCSKVSRTGAFKKAKRDAGIEVSQQPHKIEKVKMTDSNGKTLLDKNGKPIYTREYHFKNKDGKTIVIQDHSAGHDFGGIGDQGAHFNVRPIENTRTGKVPGTEAHYNFEK
ncbi:MAG: HNH/endonuclease VII fold putative polymorphic toxin, partial [Bacteroidota bacterium]